MRHARGEDPIESMFFKVYSLVDRVRSARRPTKKVALARKRPMMVRY